LYEHPEIAGSACRPWCFFCYLEAFFSFLGNQWLFNFWDKEQDKGLESNASHRLNREPDDNPLRYSGTRLKPSKRIRPFVPEYLSGRAIAYHLGLRTDFWKEAMLAM
jgi:hypothetical protein